MRWFSHPQMVIVYFHYISAVDEACYSSVFRCTLTLLCRVVSTFRKVLIVKLYINVEAGPQF